MKLLWVGDISPTGFGSVTSDVGLQLIRLGVDVRFLSQNDVGELGEPFGSRTLDLAFYLREALRGEAISGVRDVVGEIVSGKSAATLANGDSWGEWKPDAVILLGDFAAARLIATRFEAEFRSLPTFHYCPVEGTDLPPLWIALWSWLSPIAMSRFGQTEIAKVTGGLPPLVYHGVDTETFRPVSPSDPLVVPFDEKATKMVPLASKEACRQFFGFDPSLTYVLRTDRNMPRKRYGSLLRAMAPVLERNPQVRLIIHCSAYDQGGFLPDSLSKCPIGVQRQVILTDRPGMPRAVLAALYNAADIYASTSAEGFGLTIAEAIACGVPAVALDYSAVPEVVGPAGMLVPVDRLYDNEYDHLWAWPDETAFGDAVEYLVQHASKRRTLGAEGPRHVRENFRWDVAAERFRDIIQAAVTPALEMSA